MDPRANIEEQRVLAQRLADTSDGISLQEAASDGERLAELVLALDEWRTGGGFDPYGDDAQSNALARLMRDRPDQGVNVTRKPFDLPDGYWLVTFTPSNFTCGIAPTGDVSS